MEKVRLVFIFSRPVSPGFLKIKKTGVKPARRSSQNARNPLPLSLPPIIPNPPEIDDVEMRNEEEEEAPGPVPTNNWNIQHQDALTRIQHNDQAQNFVQNNQNRVKMEDVQNPKARDCRNFELNENNTFLSQPERILQQLQKRQWDFWQFSTSRRRSKADTAGYLRKNLMFNDYKNI